MTESLRNHRDDGGATAAHAVQAPQWHRASGVTGVLALHLPWRTAATAYPTFISIFYLERAYIVLPKFVVLHIPLVPGTAMYGGKHLRTFAGNNCIIIIGLLFPMRHT